MTIGISTASLYGKLYTEDALRFFAQNNVACAEVFLASFSEYTPAFGETLARAQGDVEVYSIHTLNSQFEPQLFSRSARQKDDAMVIYRQALQIGKRLGARVYVLHGPQQLKYTKYVTDYAFYGQRTSELAEIAREYGIMLTWENVHWTHYNHPRFMRALREYCRAPVYNTLDIKQAAQSGVTVNEYIEDMAGQIKNVHVVDFDETGRLVLPGRGQYDYRALKHALGSSYDGRVMVEVYDGCYQKPEEILESYRRLQEVWE